MDIRFSLLCTAEHEELRQYFTPCKPQENTEQYSSIPPHILCKGMLFDAFIDQLNP